jgi:hypothetical protein
MRRIGKLETRLEQLTARFGQEEEQKSSLKHRSKELLMKLSAPRRRHPCLRSKVARIPTVSRDGLESSGVGIGWSVSVESDCGPVHLEIEELERIGVEVYVLTHVYDPVCLQIVRSLL